MTKFSTLLCGVTALSLAAALPGFALAQTSQPMQSPAQSSSSMGTAYQVPLSQVNDAKAKLSNASVQDEDGNSVGSVQAIDTNGSGKPTAVKIDVGGFLGVGSKVVQVRASRLKYEQDRNVLITDMTKDQIKALPTIGT